MNKKSPISLEQLAALTQSSLVGDPHHVISGVADLETATSEQASFYSNDRYEQAMMRSCAGVVFIDAKAPMIDGKNYLINELPSRAFQQVVDYFYPPRNSLSGFKGIHPSAIIHETVKIALDVVISPQAVIDEGVQIGKGTFIGAGVYIGPDTIIGANCYIHPRVVVREECIIGDRVIIQAGAVIGSCGFGYTTGKDGKHAKLNQVGTVRIEDDVEIGANTTIDRARFNHTVIGKGSKIDNLVQIAHGVKVGSHNIIVSQTCIAGTSSTGNHVVLAGQVAVAGHLHLDSGVIVAGKSGVTKSLKAGKYNGIPAIPIEKYNRNQVFLRNIEKYFSELKKLIISKKEDADSHQ